MSNKFTKWLSSVADDVNNSEVVKVLGLAFIPAVIICLFIINQATTSMDARIKELYPHSVVMQHRNNKLHMEHVKCDLVDEVDGYIKLIAPNSCLNALVVVEACDEYDIDPIFVLAQGQIESHYGTRGIASKTNSVFNVHSFDGVPADQIIKSGKGYSHPDFSVRPYLDLLQRRYLVDGKTERDMFNSFVDTAGNRYASAENYEKSLFDTYVKIQSTTKIDSLVNEYKKYKIITYQ